MGGKKLVVIGGSAAGAKAAAKARRLDEFAEITIIQRDPDLSMAACGYPYYVGGVFDDRNKLLCTPTGIIRDAAFFAKAKGITALTETEAVFIDRLKKYIVCRDLKSSEQRNISYDKVIIATGAKPNLPPIPNIDLEGITTLLTMKDTDYLRSIRDEQKVKKAVVIGGGLIGVEVCEALQSSGIEITIIELLDQVLPFLDWELAKLVENHMTSQSVQILTSTGVKEFTGHESKLTGVRLDDGRIFDCELAVLAMGVKPNTDLAVESGLGLGPKGGILVNRYMQTSDPDIYAAGDCVEIMNRNTEKATYSPMGDLANIEGRAAGENALLGNTVAFQGTYQTGICKIFNFNAGSTGLSEKTAKKSGITDIQVAMNASPDKPGFMGAKLLVSKMVIRKSDQRLLGYQCVGPGDVSKQIAMAALAIQGELGLKDLVNADLPYAPPFSMAIDHFIASAHIMENKIKERMVGISALKVWEKLQHGERPFLLDGRSPDEFKEMRLDIGEKLIPLGMLRTRLNELPEDRNQEIICFCKISLRGYEASVILRAHGYKNVKVMEGGIMAWPYGVHH